VRAVGNRLHFRPPSETFHEFLLNLLKWTLGKDWYFSQLKGPEASRHEIVRWYVALSDWKKKTAAEENKVPGGWEATASGDVQSLISLAYDIYQLLHASSLDASVLGRLKTRDGFQGARYEIAVASIFARLLYKLQYVPPEPGKKTPELIAVHPNGKVRLAVEAKSRHRPGVLHQEGFMETAKVVRGDVRTLFEKALLKATDDVPFAVFIDLNSPPSPAVPVDKKPWFEDIRNMITRLERGTSDEPARFSVLVVTNFSYHYAKDKDAPKTEHLVVTPLHPRNPLPPAVLSELLASVASYGVVPADP